LARSGRERDGHITYLILMSDESSLVRRIVEGESSAFGNCAKLRLVGLLKVKHPGLIGE
jgi:hypothetical protein